MTGDGIAFFGYADHKLPRLLGKKPGWCDKYSSFKKLLINLIGFSVITYVIESNLRLFGELKS